MKLNLASGVGWLESHANRWPVVPLRLVARMGTGHTPDRNKPEYWERCHIPWVTTPDVTSRPNAITPLMDTQQKISDLGLANSAAVLHPAGTVMLSRTASVGYSALIGRPMATTQAFVTWTPGPLLEPRYLLYVLRAMSGEWDRLAYGSTHKTIYMPDLESIRIPLPPVDEQRRIADFLDAATRRVEQLVAAYERLRLNFAGRRWSLFQDLLQRVEAPLAPLRRAIEAITDGPFGSAFSSADYSDVGAAVVRLGNIGFGEYRNHEQAHIPLDLYVQFLRHRVRAGNLLIAGLGDERNHAGRACVAPDLGPAIVKGKCFCARVNKRLADGSFLALLLSSPIGEQAMDSRGSTRAMINLEVVKSAVLPLPQLSDQQRIAQEMRLADQLHHQIAHSVGRQENLLAERRQALITAAVTGHVDVTTARGVDE